MAPKPHHVFAVNHVQVGRGGKGVEPLFRGAHNAGDPQMPQVLPFLRFLAPCVFRDPLRGNDQHRAVLQIIVEQPVDGGQRGGGLPAPHPPKERAGGALDNPLDAGLLMRVRCKGAHTEAIRLLLRCSAAACLARMYSRSALTYLSSNDRVRL